MTVTSAVFVVSKSVSVSVSEAMSLPFVSVRVTESSSPLSLEIIGVSFVPFIVMVTSSVSTPPFLSSTVTSNFRIMVSPSARKSTLELAIE